MRHERLAAITLGLTLAISACDHPPRGTRQMRELPHAQPDRAPEVLRAHGCTGCHIVPGVTGAKGLAGPPLYSFSKRRFIAGRVANTPENLTAFILDPQAVKPRSAMPRLAVPYEDARDMAAYLYSLR